MADRLTENPIYFPIDDGDTTSRQYFESHDIPVRKIALNGVSHLYAIIGAETEECAANINRYFSTNQRKEKRDTARRWNYEVSYDGLLDSGFDSAADDSSDPSEIVAGLTITEALLRELSTLSSEKRRLCKMIGNKEPERGVATELGIAQTTLNGRKKRLLNDLHKKLKNYE